MGSKQANMCDKRLMLLKSIGFNSFNEYISSDVWENVRSSQLRKRTRCYLCSARATQVQPLCYRKRELLGWRRAKLISLCKRCHTLLEFNGDRKLSMKELRRKLGHFKAEIRRRRELGLSPNDWMLTPLPPMPPSVRRSVPKVDVREVKEVPLIHRTREDWVKLEAQFTDSLGRMLAQDKVAPNHLVPEHLRRNIPTR